MVQAISSSTPIMVPNLLRVQNNNGKMAVPVRPNVQRYANFKHIIGIPDRSNTSTISVNKLRTLDNLIAKLVGKQGKAESFLKVSGENVDKIISNLEQEFHYKQMAQSTKMFAPRPQTGIMINLLA